MLEPANWVRNIFIFDTKPLWNLDAIVAALFLKGLGHLWIPSDSATIIFMCAQTAMTNDSHKRKALIEKNCGIYQ